MDQIEQVKKLREEYERALDAAEARRSAYHEAVMALYSGGTPLREIAKELGLSHQRVHQIVSSEAPPRGRSKLPRAAGGAAGVVLIFVAVTFGALRLTHTAPFASGPHPLVTIPDVVGQPAHEAIRHLAEVGLSARVFRVQHDAVLRPGEIFRQKGPAGSFVAGGSVVTLFMANTSYVPIRRATRFVALHLGHGFVPGGAVLSKQRRVLSSVTSLGPVSLWVAPDRVSATGRCSWLEVGQRGSGGSCYQPSQRSIRQVVPVVSPGSRLARRPDELPLIWGRTSATVSRLTLVFQDGRRVHVPVRDGMFLYAASGARSRLRRGHHPAFLVVRDAQGHIVDKRAVRLDRAAQY